MQRCLAFRLAPGRFLLAILAAYALLLQSIVVLAIPAAPDMAQPLCAPRAGASGQQNPASPAAPQAHSCVCLLHCAMSAAGLPPAGPGIVTAKNIGGQQLRPRQASAAHRQPPIRARARAPPSPLTV
ncbi:MAG: hypothetical protein AB7F96_11845 [Beijerinckiaceae bacterium]